jgi:hypothetical protein
VERGGEGRGSGWWLRGQWSSVLRYHAALNSCMKVDICSMLNASSCSRLLCHAVCACGTAGVSCGTSDHASWHISLPVMLRQFIYDLQLVQSHTSKL